MDIHNELNQKLVEEFGILEKLCNQIYGDKHGVTWYIEDMKRYSYYARRKVYDWDYYYEKLKQVRHKRNNLSHGEVSFSECYAKDEDINFIMSFYDKILKQEDPITLYIQLISRKEVNKSVSYTKKTKRYESSDFFSNFKAFFILCFVAALILAVLILMFTYYFK